MRKGRFFRRRRLDLPASHFPHASDTLHQWQDDIETFAREGVGRLQYHGRELGRDLSRLTRKHPAATLFFAGAATGLLLWALLRRRSTPHHIEGMGHW